MSLKSNKKSRGHREDSHVKIEAEMSDVAISPRMPRTAGSYLKLRRGKEALFLRAFR